MGKKNRNQMILELLLDEKFTSRHRDRIKDLSYSHLCQIYRLWFKEKKYDNIPNSSGYRLATIDLILDTDYRAKLHKEMMEIARKYDNRKIRDDILFMCKI